MASWTNRDKALAKMKALSPAIRAAFAHALLEQAERIAALIERRVPVVSGELLATVRVWPGGSSSTKAEKRDVDLTVDITEGGVRGQKGEYVRMIEFGTSDTAPRPHFYPSYRQLRRSVKAKIAKAGRDAARKIALK